MPTVATRPLPLNSIVKLAGVSFRQDAVRKLVEYDEVRIRHDQHNEFDEHACSVTTIDGDQLGYIPRELAARLAGPHPGGTWRARVEEVLRGETWGVRLRVGPLIAADGRDIGARVGGLRHRGDGTIEAPNGAVTLVHTPDQPEPSDQRPPAPRRHVYARSGRLLGILESVDDSKAHVRTPTGVRASYPRAIVDIRD